MSAFLSLTGEAVRDAVRRRIVAAIVVLSLLSLMVVDSCTGCAAGEVIVNGEPRSIQDLAGFAGVNLFAVLGLWVIVLAGLLAADHLQQTLEDGTANLCLARPVSRHAFALARLAGALVVAFAAGAVLLGTTAGLMHARSGLDLQPALRAGAGCALGVVTTASLAMAASLYLPRMATSLLVIGAVGTTSVANLVALARRGEAEGALYWIDRIGPPLLTTMAKALDPWIPALAIEAEPAAATFRLVAWAGASLAALTLAFRRFEIRG